MRHHIRQFVTIAGLTAVEAFRQPIVMLLVYVSVVFTGLLPILITHVLRDAPRMIRDSALALHFVTGLLLGGYAACAALSFEIRRGTVASVLSKPVGKATFFLAKYAGIAIVVALFSAAMAAATLMSVRTVGDQFRFDWWGSGLLLAAAAAALVSAGLHNYFLRAPFVSRAVGYLLVFLAVAVAISASVPAVPRRAGPPLDWGIVPASVLITMAIFILSGLAVSLATRLDVVGTLSVCSVVFLTGLMSDYFVGRAGGHRTIALLLDLLPNWQHFWAVDALSRHGVPWSYVGHAGLYATLYLAGILSAGILAFRRMEVR